MTTSAEHTGPSSSDDEPSFRFKVAFATAMVVIALGWSWVWHAKTERVVVEAPPVIAVVGVTTDTLRPGNTPAMVATLSDAFARIPGLTVVSADRLFELAGGDSLPAALVAAAREAGAAEVLQLVLEQDAAGYALEAERLDAVTRESRGTLRAEASTLDDVVDLMTAHVAMRFGLRVPMMEVP